MKNKCGRSLQQNLIKKARYVRPVHHCIMKTHLHISAWLSITHEEKKKNRTRGAHICVRTRRVVHGYGRKHRFSPPTHVAKSKSWPELHWQPEHDDVANPISPPRSPRHDRT